jgi:hypothetical protein
METTICPDILLEIYKLIPYHAKNLALTSKYCYNTFKNHKSDLCTGNYILSSIQKRLINEMIDHVNTIQSEPLIIQSNISTGKTAAILAFSLKCIQNVVIMIPYTIMPHWVLEIKKMFSNHASIAIIHQDYNKKLYQQCKVKDFNPSSINKKVIIVTSSIKTNIHLLTKHSLVIMDEVHKLGTKIYGNPKFIGVSASNPGWYHANYKIYSDEESLPNLKYHNILCPNISNINNIIKNIQTKSKGPYLLLCKKETIPLINISYTNYDNSLNTLKSVKYMNENDTLLLCPDLYSTGINLNYIKCIIFIYPTLHLNNTVIQSIGRVTRTTNMTSEVLLYNIHENEANIILHQATVSENEIIKFCKDNNLTMNKHARYKSYLSDIINLLLKKYSFDLLINMNKLYFTSILRIMKKDFIKINTLISNYLKTDISIINKIIK